MHSLSTRTAFLITSLSILGISTLHPQETPSVKLIRTVELPGYTGDFDHFAVDFDRNRLLLAAEDHGTLEVFDLKTSAHLRTVDGFGNPHSILVRKGSPTVLVTDSEKQIAVVDRRTLKLLATWPVTPAKQNAMVAFDPDQHRLYVVCRDPGRVIVMNSDNGAIVDTQPAPLRSDEVQYDREKHRLYVPGGEGYMGIYDARDPDHLKLIEKISTAPGAKTGLLVTSLHRLYLAVSPGDTKATAKVLTYEVE